MVYAAVYRNLEFTNFFKVMMKKQKTKYPGVFFADVTDRVTGRLARWFYIQFYDPQGKRRMEKAGSSLTGMTEAKANQLRGSKATGHAELNQVKRERKRAEKQAEQNRWTFDRLWQRYLENKPNFKSRRRDECVYRANLKARFGDRLPEEIHPLEIDRLKRDLYKRGSKDQTVKNILALLRRIANWGKRRQVSAGLSFMIDMPKPKNIVREALSRERLRALLIALEQTEDRLEASFIYMLIFTGRRPGELCKLKWTDIDLLEQKMILRDTKTQSNEGLPLCDFLVEMLETMPRYSLEWVFPNHYGGQRQRLDISGRRIIRGAGIPNGVRPAYCLRHTFASIAAEVIEKDYVIKELMGHSNPNRDITARYAKVSHKALLKGANQVQEEILSLLEGQGQQANSCLMYGNTVQLIKIERSR